MICLANVHQEDIRILKDFLEITKKVKVKPSPLRKLSL